MTKLIKTNTALSSIFPTKPAKSVCNLPYGAASNVHSKHLRENKKKIYGEKLLASTTKRHLLSNTCIGYCGTFYIFYISSTH